MTMNITNISNGMDYTQKVGTINPSLKFEHMQNCKGPDLLLITHNRYENPTFVGSR